MDFSYSEEQEALRDLARRILEDLATQDRLREVEAGEEGFDRALWDELARANLLGASLPEAWGGSGYGFFDACLLLQEQGRAVAPLPLHGTLVAALALARFGSEAQQRAWLPGVVEGRTRLAVALADEGSDDLLHPVARARRSGDGGAGWRLDGRKVAVEGAHLAARLLVTASDEAGAARVFLVDPSGPGVTLERQTATHRAPVFWVDLRDAPAEPVEGADVAWVVDRALVAQCAVQLGVSERALEMTADYGRQREQFGRPIGSFQAFHQRAADAYIQCEAMRLTLWQAAFRLDREEPPGDAVAIARFWASEGGQFVGYAAQHLHGGIGMDIDYPLHRYYMWAKHLDLTLSSPHRALLNLRGQSPT